MTIRGEKIVHLAIKMILLGLVTFVLAGGIAGQTVSASEFFATLQDRLIKDVMLLTVLPNPDEHLRDKKLILVDPGHGSGCRLADIMGSPDMLEEIRRETAPQRRRNRYEWFQAVFQFSVVVTQDREDCLAPSLWDVQSVLI